MRHDTLHPDLPQALKRTAWRIWIKLLILFRSL